MIADASESSYKIQISVNAIALTIAGSDPSGGAGLQADLKVFQQLGVYGMSAVTLVTAQNTVGVQQIELLPAPLVGQQIQSVLEDIPPRAIKTGALGSAGIVGTVVESLRDWQGPLIVDPVLVSKHGDSLAGDDVVQAYREQLLPRATLITPNRFEAEKLSGVDLADSESTQRAMQNLHAAGAQAILLKLGERDGDRVHLFSQAGEENFLTISTRSLPHDNVHGSGCVLSAIVTAALVLGAPSLQEAVDFAVGRTFEAISVGNDYGRGISPVEVRALRKA